MARRLKKLTISSCLEAIAAWLRSEMDIDAGISRSMEIDGALWIDFADLRPFKFHNHDLEIGPYIRGVLLNRAPKDSAAPFFESVLVIDLLDGDCTPRVDRSRPGVAATETMPPLRTIAIVATPDAVEARDVTIVDHGLGSRRVWPFDD